MLSEHFLQQLSQRAHPKTLCPSEIARSLSVTELRTLGVREWRDLMPRLRSMAFEARDRGEVEILQRGEVVDEASGIDDVRGPIRIRRRQ
ncbi:uncharacterized protein A1O9_00716 [Exophiala aquamarina CBS 119918]|uniref:Uncharacterized protein n=1 Tax=Exophiala aquamarina CBS 119918 TaxID=1182545 RepID=A0A072PTT9_9EURO|nr:uncharacterized protein A1O9_00716 [Exophiala aquamarina CBS 119918]KEF62743.1 hypothetical protein A1O9_00716 [Exophiala aquamarina CBS 119918]